MRDFIAQPVSTSTGMPVRLRVSQGIHAGTFSVFMVDGNHRELMVTGAGTTETVECEATASAGQILLSSAAAANVDRSWLGRAIDGRHLLRRVVALDDVVDATGTNGRRRRVGRLRAVGPTGADPRRRAERAPRA